MEPGAIEEYGAIEELQCGAVYWRITGDNFPFSLDDSFVVSPQFKALGHKWTLRCYPAGILGEDGGEPTRFRLVLVDRAVTEDVAVTFEIASVDSDGNVMKDKTVRRMRYSFNTSSIVRRKSPSVMMDDGCMLPVEEGAVVLCRMWKDPSNAAMDGSSSNIVNIFERLYATSEMADVEFIVSGRVFKAHKLVLAARSPVFKAQFYGSSAERVAANPIKVRKMKALAFQALLHFIYTDSMLGDVSNISAVRETLEAADRYKLEGLKMMCEEKLRDSVTVETVASLLLSAQKYNCELLKAVCYIFILNPRNNKEVMTSDSYLQMARINPSILEELRRKKEWRAIEKYNRANPFIPEAFP